MFGTNIESSLHVRNTISELERGLYEHREHPVIYQIYHPRVFSRATALSFDICYHLKTVTWQTDPYYVEFYNNIPKPIQEYLQRLAYLGRPEASNEEVVYLAAHAYVRYLGDLSGGQIIRRRIIKAYDLYEDGDGLAFYNFRTLDYRTGDKPAEMHEIRKIKTWFKNGLNETITDPKMKGKSSFNSSQLDPHGICVSFICQSRPINSFGAHNLRYLKPILRVRFLLLPQQIHVHRTPHCRGKRRFSL